MSDYYTYVSANTWPQCRNAINQSVTLTIIRLTDLQMHELDWLILQPRMAVKGTRHYVIGAVSTKIAPSAGLLCRIVSDGWVKSNHCKY
jgi:hypothetical protein